MPAKKDDKVEDRALVLRRVRRAFEVFDQSGNNTCDVREVGTIVRSLGVHPSESQLHDLIKEMEDEEPTGYIQWEKFNKVVMRIMDENQFPRDTEERILKAFMVLDTDKKGYLLPDDLKRYMTTEGEPFSEEEIEEMLSTALDPEKGVIFYEDFVSLLVAND